MRKLYPRVAVFLMLLLIALIPQKSISQVCAPLVSSYHVTESRCAATGAIEIIATGGSGSYQYKVSGPVNTNYTSINEITGLSAGTYLVTILDINTNCVYNQDSVFVPGNYITPGFSMISTNVSCPNGTDGTITVTGQSFGRAPFSYKIVAPSASAIGTVSTSGNFTGLISGDYSIQLTDSCGGIQTRLITLMNYNWHINNYSVLKIGCDSIAVTINLIDAYGNVTPNPIFNGFLYGASVIPGDTTWFTSNHFTYYKGNKHRVTLFVKDLCGNLRSVVWIDNLVPTLNANVTISNKACTTFTAGIAGQSNLTNPNYCLYDANDVLLSCNNSGVFNLLPYGNYCIKVTDICYDTTITRCFSATKPVPSVGANVNIIANCSSFAVNVTGQTNLSNPYYCLYDSTNALLYCDSTGIFNELPFGSYCIKISTDPLCYDTTIIRCFTVIPPIPAAGPDVSITNLTCSTFTASITDTSNWNNPQYCLYTDSHQLVVCNNTGVFTGLLFGSYCIEIVNGPGCYDTTIIRCFTVNRPIPTVNANPSITNKTCTSFTASINGQTNLNNPTYCLYDNLHVLLNCNSTGVFANLGYGGYCITIQNDASCYDTTISRCFDVTQPIAEINLSSKKSCSLIGGTDIRVAINAGVPAYSISLFSPMDTLIQTVITSSNSYSFTGLPNLPPGQQYKVVLTDQCGNKDSVRIRPVVSVAVRMIRVSPKCPSSTLLSGYGDILIDVTNNNIGGNIKPKIIKKNGVSVSVNATSNTGYSYSFLGLEPATYIFDTYISDCNAHLFDTVTVRPYFFPDLNGSRAYQCDNGSFVINVNAVNGIPPFQYEIFGSTPATPSIIAGPQAGSVFNINNGTSYSLIRLRVVDGCGNASLKDASVLPLASFYAFADTLQCINHSLTLRVDSVANAGFTWYKRIAPNDSVVVGTNSSYFIPSLQLNDTGRYVCKIIVYGGCVVRIANYVVTGYCGGVLPINVNLSGTKQRNGNQLTWSNERAVLDEYILERSAGINSIFQSIHYGNHAPAGQHFFLDENAFEGDNFYRLAFRDNDGNARYSNIVQLFNSNADITVYPNPVNNLINVSISNKTAKDYLIEINNSQGQKLLSKKYYHIQQNVIMVARDPAIKPGLYVITIKDLRTNESKIIKLIFK
ncbi:hypothetical protein BH11BAC4_BH11BAC4_09000 [soil metagenome]